MEIGKTYPLRSETAVVRTIDNEAVVVSPEDAVMHNLNEIGTIVWELADGLSNVETIANKISDDFDMSAKEILNDVGEFCLSMADRHIFSLLDSPLKQ